MVAVPTGSIQIALPLVLTWYVSGPVWKILSTFSVVPDAGPAEVAEGGYLLAGLLWVRGAHCSFKSWSAVLSSNIQKLSVSLQFIHACSVLWA